MLQIKKRDSEPYEKDVHSLRGSILLDKKDNKKKRREINESASTCCFCFTSSSSKPKKQKKNKEVKQDQLDMSMVTGVVLGHEPLEEMMEPW